jgi:cyclic beta-1,2-glucan synthetase
MHRAAITSIFGLEQEADTLRFTPCLPSHWPQAEITLRRGERSMRFILTRSPPDAALAAAAQWNARLLRVGEALAWTDLAAHTCFVVPIGTFTP